MRFEAEQGTRFGDTVKVASAIPGYSGTGYVTGFTSDSCYLEIPFSVGRGGLYEVIIGYHSEEDKGFVFQMNDNPSSSGTFTSTGDKWGRVSAGKFLLATGSSKAFVRDGWGYYEVDYIDVIPARVSPPTPPPLTLADPQSTDSTHQLFSMLVSLFGRRVIAGTQVREKTLDAVQYAFGASGKRPALVEGGLLKYSPSWADRGGDANASGYVEALGQWATETTKHRGLLALCWHWNAPCRLKDTREHPDSSYPWYQGFYTKNSDFNLSFALLHPGSEDHAKLIGDLDVIAAQLQKLAALDIPVLWRPLHEAYGGWFWWGACGPSAFQQLWRLMFARFTQVHNLHNLIWVYTADPAVHHDWYPGHDVVDIVGADIYQPKGSTMDATWAAFKDKFDGQKLITLSETGALVVPSSVRALQTMWSWFNTWDITKYSITPEEIKAVYTDQTVLTLDELPDWRAGVGVSRMHISPRNMATEVVMVVVAVVMVLLVVAVLVVVVTKVRLSKSNVPVDDTKLNLES